MWASNSPSALARCPKCPQKVPQIVNLASTESNVRFCGKGDFFGVPNHGNKASRRTLEDETGRTQAIAINLKVQCASDCTR